MRLYKRNSKGYPIVWEIDKYNTNLLCIKHGVVGKTLVVEHINTTKKKVDEYESRITAKRKEGYKELSELKDSTLPVEEMHGEDLYNYLNSYLPKYNTTDEGFVLPMLAKTLEDNKLFEKYGMFLGQYKINGLRCIVGAEKKEGDLFNPIKLTYTSREGTKWNLFWMDELIIPGLDKDLLEAMVYGGVCLDGELYLPGYTVNEINSFVKNNKLPNHYKLQYWCYDICCEDTSAETRRDRLVCGTVGARVHVFKSKEQHLNNTNRFVLLPSVSVDSITEAIKLRNDFISYGFEGLILRNPNSYYQFGKRNGAMFKYKKVDDGLFVIEDIRSDKQGLPIYTLKNDINSERFECTINLPQDAQRAHLEMKNLLIGKEALVEFRERSGVKQVPFHAKIIRIYV